MSSKIKVSVIGITGYTGTELLRCLLQHEDVEIKYLVSRQHDGTPLSNLFPRLNHIEDLTVTKTDHNTVAKESDLVFLCLPHKAAQEVVPAFLGKTKIIDFSADFRLNDKEIYKKYYHIPRRASAAGGAGDGDNIGLFHLSFKRQEEELYQ